MQTTVVWTVLGAAALLYLGAVLAGVLAAPTAGDAAGEYFSGPFLDRAAAYQRAGLTVSLIRQALSLFLLAALAWAALSRFRTAPQPSPAAAAGYIFAFLLLMQALGLPLDFYRGYTVERRFGLSTQTAAGWFADYGKSTLVGLLISAAALIGLYILITRRPEHWWFLAGTALFFFLLLSTYLYPLLVEPLFHRFTPLRDEAMQAEILELAGKAGIEVEHILVADASRRTRKANAYFSGMGRTKRIVIYDTLLENFTPGEVLAVIAHEMGHWRRRHLVQGILISTAGSFVALYILHLLLQRMGLQADFRALPAALLFFTLLSMAVAPAQNFISRSWEREADRTAFSLIGEPEPFVSLYRKLALSNLSVVQPHPLLKAVLYTHPPPLERIEAALQYAGERKRGDGQE